MFTFLTNLLQPHCNIGAHVRAILRSDYSRASTLALPPGDERSPREPGGTGGAGAVPLPNRPRPGPDPTAIAVISPHGLSVPGCVTLRAGDVLGVSTITGLTPFGRLFSPKRSQPPVNPTAQERSCGQCMACVAACPSGALTHPGDVWRLDLSICLGCRLCHLACPNPD